MNSNTGTLYLVATPIGNLEDITFRAIRILKEVDLIAAEDTRHTLKLLNHFEIKQKLISYHQHNERERAPEIIRLLTAGLNVAVVSDAGMPGISDPGSWLVAEAIKLGISVVPVPGASAVVTALAASGLASKGFYFKGFLPRKSNDQMEVLKQLASIPDTLIFYEAPHRLAKTLANIYKVFGNRPAVLARELTKVHEEFVRADLNSLIKMVEQFGGKGEYTILVTGSSNHQLNLQNSTNELLTELADGLSVMNGTLKEKLKKIAKKTGRSTKEIYRLYLQQYKHPEDGGND